MAPVTLKKVERDQLIALQEGVFSYSNSRRDDLTPQLSFTYLDTLLHLHTCKKMFLKFRKQLETDKLLFTVKLETSEAVLLYYCCHHLKDIATQSSYNHLTGIIYGNILHHTLTNLRTQYHSILY